jgi:carbon monoxide dehydrogenase subunit G
MAEAKASKIIDVPADRVWETVRAFSHLERYFTVFVSSTIEGSGVGATRTLSLPDGGGQFHERLEALDDDARTLTYVCLESPLPIENYVGTVTVEGAGEGKSRVTWSASFDTSAEQEPAMVAMLSDTYAGGIDGLEAKHKV